jgi:DNA-binding beta-propeller fold protein YncE
VAVVLGDALRRLCVLGGREGMPRSLVSVYGAAVTRFLGGGLQGVVSRVIPTPGLRSFSNGVAVSRDGSTLLVSDCSGGSHAIHEYSVADGSAIRVIGKRGWFGGRGAGDGRLQFHSPCQLWIAPDDFVFVADSGNRRVQVLTPRLDFHCFIGVGQLHSPAGVCADADVVVVSERDLNRIAVFNRRDGALLRFIGCGGSGDGELDRPLALCFTPDGRVAVADSSNSRVSVISVAGDFIRHVGVAVLSCPEGVACTAYGEIIVGDWGCKRVAVFSRGGKLLTKMSHGDFAGIAACGRAFFAQDCSDEKCVVFQ